MPVFLAVVLSIWTTMHAYVLWRAWPLAAAHVPLGLYLGLAALLWAAYPAGRLLDAAGGHTVGAVLEFAGAQWLGIMFLLVVALLAADVVTGFGWWLPGWIVAARGTAVALALLLAAIGAVQAVRAPVVRSHDVILQGLPRALDGTVVVVLSDLHVGQILGERWLRARIAQVDTLRPDLVIVAGDLVDGNADHVRPLAPVMAQLKAPLGVFAVTGNHEFYAGLDRSLDALHAAGYRVLRDESVPVAPGLSIAGIDDLTARHQYGTDGPAAVRNALAGRPPGATIFVSHTPWYAAVAAQNGAGLMLSGHTHDGQIWPFRYVVERQYPQIAGRYDIDGMAMIVCRGTGTWGPRIRLWYPSEVLRITLRAA